MHVVVETPDFIAEAKAAGITDEERSEIVRYREPAVPAKSAFADVAKARAEDTG